MKKRNALFSFALLGALLAEVCFVRYAPAQAADDLNQLKDSSARVSFVPPSDSPSPRRTQSGASRIQLPGVCGGLPLVPESGLGLTTGSSPSLFVYFSEGTTVENALLTLKSSDSEESEYYETLVDIPREKLSDSGGVVEFQMPEVASELALGEEYQWYLALTCEGNMRPDSPFIKGLVKRVEAANAVERANSGSLMEKAIAYGSEGVWYDLLSTLATMRSANPEDTSFAAHWAGIMETSGLEEIASEPLIIQD